MDNEAVDSALILENELKRRVREVVDEVVRDVVRKVLAERLAEAKEHMLMEVSIAIGKTIRAASAEERKPLWEYTPEELHLKRGDIEEMQAKHMISGFPGKGITNG